MERRALGMHREAKSGSLYGMDPKRGTARCRECIDFAPGGSIAAEQPAAARSSARAKCRYAIASSIATPGQEIELNPKNRSCLRDCQFEAHRFRRARRNLLPWEGQPSGHEQAECPEARRENLGARHRCLCTLSACLLPRLMAPGRISLLQSKVRRHR